MLRSPKNPDDSTHSLKVELWHSRLDELQELKQTVELHRSLTDELFLLENSIQTQLDEFKNMATVVNAALAQIFLPDVPGLLNENKPKGIFDLIRQYADLGQMEFGKLKLTPECRQILNDIIDAYLLKESKQIDACSNKEAEQCISILSDLLMTIRNNHLPTLLKPDQYFFKEQWCIRYILKVLKSSSLLLAASEDDKQGIIKAIDHMAEANDYISVEIEKKRSSFSDMEWLHFRTLPVTGFLKITQVAYKYAGNLTKSSPHLKPLKTAAIDLMNQLSCAANKACPHTLSSSHLPETRAYAQMDLLTRISLLTLKLMHRPDDRLIEQYRALRRETAHHSNLKLVVSYMGLFLGAVLELVFIWPKLVSYCRGKTTVIKSNFIFHQSITFFQQGLIAKKMDRVLAEIPSEPALYARSKRLASPR